MSNSVDYLLVGHALVVFHSLRYTSELNSERQLQMAPSTGVHFWHPLCNLTGLLRVAFQSQIFQAIDSHLADNVSYTNLRSHTKHSDIVTILSLDVQFNPRIRANAIVLAHCLCLLRLFTNSYIEWISLP